jgi:peptidoglycan/LPS O-acetylase OafA/YrhL
LSAGEVVAAPRTVAAPHDEKPASAGRSHRRPTLTHQPALDGLRGLAVAAVVLFHLDHLRGGFLGVDLFFVLSGFLITSLLLTEVGATGVVGLGGFWVRRARRLLPALVLLLVAVAVTLLIVTPKEQRALFRDDGLATIGYVANWHRVTSEAGYWDAYSQSSPFEHMWSLAIEEQFYLLWPLVVAGLAVAAGRRRRRVATNGNGGEAAGRPAVARLVLVGAGIGSVVSFAWLAASFDPLDTNFAYFSTPTRLGPILAGAAFAAYRVGRPERTGPPDRKREALALVAAVVAVWLAFDLTATASAYYRGGLLAFTVASLVVVGVVTGGPLGRFARGLAVRPLTFLGTISYGIYLWHVPVIVFGTADRVHLGGWPLDIVRVLLTLAASTASYLLVERRIRHGAIGGRRLLGLAFGGLAVATVMVLIATAGKPASERIEAPKGRLAGTDNQYLYVPEEVAPGVPRVLLVGDSGPQHLGAEMKDILPDHDLAFAFASHILCSPVTPEGVVKAIDGSVDTREVCHAGRRKMWTRLVDEFDPDIVIYYLANAGGSSEVMLDGRWTTDCEPDYDAYLTEALDQDADLLTAHGARILFATPPYPVSFEEHSKQRVDCRADLMRNLAASRPDGGVVELNQYVRQQSVAGIDMYADPIHLSAEGSRLVSDWLIPQLEKTLTQQPG